LKQAQYTPYPVEEQIAIIYCGTKGLLQKVPIRRIQDFESEYLNKLRECHQETLELLKNGVLDECIENTLKEVCEQVSKKYE